MNKRSLRAPRFAVTAIECFERPGHVAAAVPLRCGDGDARHRRRSCARSIHATDGREAQGMAAELMIPKWFDKSPERSNARQHRRSASLARAGRHGLLRELGAANRVRPRDVPLSRAAGPRRAREPATR